MTEFPITTAVEISKVHVIKGTGNMEASDDGGNIGTLFEAGGSEGGEQKLTPWKNQTKQEV